MKKKEDNGYKKVDVLHKGQNGSSVYLAIDGKKKHFSGNKVYPEKFNREKFR